LSERGDVANARARIKERKQALEIATQQLGEMERTRAEAWEQAKRFALDKTSKAMAEAKLKMLREFRLEHERAIERSQAAIREIEDGERTVQRELNQHEDRKEGQEGRAPWDEFMEIEQAVVAQRQRVSELRDMVEGMVSDE
jgi:hypothetical protein